MSDVQLYNIPSYPNPDTRARLWRRIAPTSMQTTNPIPIRACLGRPDRFNGHELTLWIEGQRVWAHYGGATIEASAPEVVELIVTAQGPLERAANV